jgi:hypothetical protein
MNKFFALWVNKSKDGKQYMSGTLGDMKIMIFKNDRKEKENQPDYVAYLAPKERKEQQQQEAEESPF